MQRIVTVAAVFFVSSMSHAYDFAAADQLFLKRSDGLTAINAAVSKYEEALTSGVTGTEKAYAVEQIAALHVYHSYLVDDDNIDERVRVANLCLRAVAKITPSASEPTTPQYYFWKAACLMKRADAQGGSTALGEARNILDAINAGMRANPLYEGGGFDRLAGVLYAKLPVFNPFGPSGDMNKAYRHFRRSLEAGAYVHPLNPNWRNPDFETGAYFYTTHFYFGEAMIANGDHEEARDFLEQAIAEIDAGTVAPGREAETALSKLKMSQLIDSL